jgi:rRNA-processing protein FCF1
MKKIVVNDTNVFIDLLDVGLLDEFFQLSWEIHTTDFVMFELFREGQKEAVAHFQKMNRLHVASFEPEELTRIRGLHKLHESKTNVSFTDCSVWYYAKSNGYALLTGDRKLRMYSQKDDVEVRGILYVFDMLVEEKIIIPSVAAERLMRLCELNPRLPKDETENRIKAWTK